MTVATENLLRPGSHPSTLHQALSASQKLDEMATATVCILQTKQLRPERLSNWPITPSESSCAKIPIQVGSSIHVLSIIPICSHGTHV